MPLVEAMACGAPVVASRSAATPEIAGGAALLCDPEDPGEHGAGDPARARRSRPRRRAARARSSAPAPSRGRIARAGRPRCCAPRAAEGADHVRHRRQHQCRCGDARRHAATGCAIAAPTATRSGRTPSSTTGLVHTAARHHRSVARRRAAAPLRGRALSPSPITARSSTTAPCAPSSKPPASASPARATPRSCCACCSARGVAALDRVVGMFAFALWDRERREMLLGRDRLGIKPLLYAALPDGGLAFASEIAALRAHPGIDLALDRAALSDYLACLYVPAPRTFHRGISKLPPGHVLRWRDGRIEAPRPYWHAALRRHARPQRRRGGRGADAAAAPRRRRSHGRRRAGRLLPLRRHRQLGDRGADGRRAAQARRPDAPQLHHDVRRGGV